MGVPPEELTEVVLVLKAAKKGKYSYSAPEAVEPIHIPRTKRLME
jgi:hypothetical protein